MAKKKNKNWLFLVSAILLSLINSGLGTLTLTGGLFIISFIMPLFIYLISLWISSVQFKLKAKDYLLPAITLTLSFYAILYSTLGIVFLAGIRGDSLVFVPLISASILNPFIILFFKFKLK